MTNENVTEKKETRKQPSLNDYVQKLNEQRAALVRSVISTVLKDSDKFKTLLTSYSEAKRLVKTCETLLSEDGYVKQKERIQAKIDELHQEFELLKTKRNVAAQSINALKNVLSKHVELQSALATKLTGSFTTDMSTEDMKMIVERELESLDTSSDALTVVDPFENDTE